MYPELLNIGQEAIGSSFKLYNQTGRLNFSINKVFDTRISIPDGVLNGFYIAEVTTENGERYIKPLILQR